MSESTRLIYSRTDRGRIVLAESACLLIQRFKQVESKDPEAGGMLLGRLLTDSDDVIIDEATEPHPRDRRTRFFFFRSMAPAQERVNAAWTGSRQSRIYLGEWHTHPEPYPTPSCIDVRTWRRISRTATFDGDALFFIICGTQSIRLWELRRVGKDPISLKVVT